MCERRGVHDCLVLFFRCKLSVGEEMQQWYGETEDSYYRTSPEQDPYISYISYFGEVCVFFHSEEGLAVTHQLFQMFQGHAASLSYSRGGHCATLLRTMN